jgi:hypothetical protein
VLPRNIQKIPVRPINKSSWKHEVRSNISNFILKESWHNYLVKWRQQNELLCLCILCHRNLKNGSLKFCCKFAKSWKKRGEKVKRGWVDYVPSLVVVKLKNVPVKWQNVALQITLLLLKSTMIVYICTFVHLQYISSIFLQHLSATPNKNWTIYTKIATSYKQNPNFLPRTAKICRTCWSLQLFPCRGIFEKQLS